MRRPRPVEGYQVPTGEGVRSTELIKPEEMRAIGREIFDSVLKQDDYSRFFTERETARVYMEMGDVSSATDMVDSALKRNNEKGAMDILSEVLIADEEATIAQEGVEKVLSFMEVRGSLGYWKEDTCALLFEAGRIDEAIEMLADFKYEYQVRNFAKSVTRAMVRKGDLENLTVLLSEPAIRKNDGAVQEISLGVALVSLKKGLGAKRILKRLAKNARERVVYGRVPEIAGLLAEAGEVSEARSFLAEIPEREGGEIEQGKAKIAAVLAKRGEVDEAEKMASEIKTFTEHQIPVFIAIAQKSIEEGVEPAEAFKRVEKMVFQLPSASLKAEGFMKIAKAKAESGLDPRPMLWQADLHGRRTHEDYRLLVTQEVRVGMLDIAASIEKANQ